MSDLKTMQGMFQGAVMGHENDFLSHIESGGKISAKRRLYIYQHAYKARLRDVLAEDFPVLHTMLGDEVFYELCHRYCDAYPSSHPSLRYFGQRLEKYVTEIAPYNEQEIIGEMARFEWAFHDVFDAGDHDYVRIEEVAALPASVWTTLRFDFHPSFFMAPYHWNVAAVWSSVQKEAEQLILPEKMPEITYVIQWRRDLLSYFRTLADDEARVLALAREGTSFPDICEALARTQGEGASERAAELLKGWIAEGLISCLHYFDINNM